MVNNFMWNASPIKIKQHYPFCRSKLLVEEFVQPNQDLLKVPKVRYIAGILRDKTMYNYDKQN